MRAKFTAHLIHDFTTLSNFVTGLQRKGAEVAHSSCATSVGIVQSEMWYVLFLYLSNPE